VLGVFEELDPRGTEGGREMVEEGAVGGVEGGEEGGALQAEGGGWGGGGGRWGVWLLWGRSDLHACVVVVVHFCGKDGLGVARMRGWSSGV